MSQRGEAKGPGLGLQFVAEAMGGTVCRTAAKGGRHFTGVAIDGRSAPTGGLWFAIRGERHDGHAFAGQAVAAGASGLVVERGRAAELDFAGAGNGVTVIEVDDTVRALGRLAHAHRARLHGLRVVGVTGSNGKTTTKELVAAILAAHAGDAAVHKTEGNFNNHLGLPLTLLKLTEAHRFAVIEMGMSARGEIAYLASLAHPDVGIIVNVGPVHLETLGSIDEIARAKGELFAALDAAGTAILPDGDARVAEQAKASRAVRQLRFGERPGVDVRVLSARTTPDGTDVALRLPDGSLTEARLALVGAHNARNAAAAAAAAHVLGVPTETIGRGLAGARSAKHRSTTVGIGGRHVLDDCYNASPLSTAAAIDALAALKGTHRAVAVLGDMLELGPTAAALHRSMGERCAAQTIDALVAVGPLAEHIAAGARDAGLAKVHTTREPAVAARIAADLTQPGDWILVKASRGMQLERTIEALHQLLDGRDASRGADGQGQG